MISKWNILFLSLILGSCANNTDGNAVAEASVNAAEAIEEVIDPSDSFEASASSNLETATEKVASKSLESDSHQTEYSEDNSVKRKPSTIAEQQEAARKIQQELEARSPRPNEDKNLENAVFEKIVKKSEVKKSDPQKVETKKKEVVKADTKKSKPTAPKRRKGYPAIEFEKMTMVFDTIQQGDLVDHDFIFTNTGNAPLEIKSARASCGCTQPSFPFIPIEPNEQGRISVRYNSVGKEGNQAPDITVTTNINSKELILVMEGFVVVPEKEEGSK